MAGERNGAATALPSSLALAASFDRDLSYAFGEPRGGRAFEYHGEDPILAGKMIAPQLRAIQDQGVVATIKHYALNDQETGRFGANAIIEERAVREGELLAFEIGLKESGAGAVMCSYNRVNGDYACENDYLLNRVLKGEWAFKGWVMSDWSATRSTVKAAMAGLDQEFFMGRHFGKALSEAIDRGEVPEWRLDDMCRRILRSLIATGAIDRPSATRPVDSAPGAAVALRAAQEGAVLLKNVGVLPLRDRPGLAMVYPTPGSPIRS